MFHFPRDNIIQQYTKYYIHHFDTYLMENYDNVIRMQFNAIVSAYMFSDTY